MSASFNLQGAIHGILVDDAAIGALVDDRIYDGPERKAQFPHISFGPSDWLPDDEECIDGRVETLQVDCWSRDDGQQGPCRALVDAVAAALKDVEVDLGDAGAAYVRVVRARVMMDPDGIGAHGIVTVEAMTEVQEA